ncbi:hypothetical protein L1049_001972 [Liquidambar formosana]|uniref:Uncharacterized protein n=1 Tax=Liquidambar formosana TaxID=63359 RepID=A0AAP0NGW4_LIQFO
MFSNLETPLAAKRKHINNQVDRRFTERLEIKTTHLQKPIWGCVHLLSIFTMSAIEMASASKFSYQRLKDEIGFDDDYEERVRVMGGQEIGPSSEKFPVGRGSSLESQA